MDANDNLADEAEIVGAANKPVRKNTGLHIGASDRNEIMRAYFGARGDEPPSGPPGVKLATPPGGG